MAVVAGAEGIDATGVADVVWLIDLRLLDRTRDWDTVALFTPHPPPTIVAARGGGSVETGRVPVLTAGPGLPVAALMSAEAVVTPVLAHEAVLLVVAVVVEAVPDS